MCEDDCVILILFMYWVFVVVFFINDLEFFWGVVLVFIVWGGISLFISIVFFFYYLCEVFGKCVLIFVSDGVDEDSSLIYDNVFDYVVCVDVVIYIIGFGVLIIG